MRGGAFPPHLPQKQGKAEAPAAHERPSGCRNLPAACGEVHAGAGGHMEEVVTPVGGPRLSEVLLETYGQWPVARNTHTLKQVFPGRTLALVGDPQQYSSTHEGLHPLGESSMGQQTERNCCLRGGWIHAGEVHQRLCPMGGDSTETGEGLRAIISSVACGKDCDNIRVPL
ncbi:hypothetical protein BTVI_09004 [Pitangus sulphuratus]|nr:hypothetical protein BTVI_09004 [Pitangus sulphuratus]